MKKFCAYIFACLLLLSSCEKALSPEEQKAADEQLIQDYIKANNLVAFPAEDGLYYTMSQEGTGKQATQLSTVAVEYTGSFLEGGVFDSSVGRSPIQGKLSNFIRGWTLGIPYFKEGGIGKLIIPSHLAYGPRGSGSIPPNTCLVFDIRLVTVF